MRTFTNLSEKSHYVTSPDFGYLTGSIATSNSFGTSLNITPGIAQIGTTGTWTGTVTLQFSPDNSNWYDVESYTSNTSKAVTLGMRCYIRLGIKAASYTTGTINWLVGQGY